MESYEKAVAMAYAFVLWTLLIFVALFILTVSVHHPLLPDVPQLLAPPFDWLAQKTGLLLTGKAPTERNVSDSPGMQLHVLNLLLLSIISGACGAIWHGKKRAESHASIKLWLVLLSRYYLAAMLLMYGFNKVFKWQFYYPEPNILYTPVRQLSSDILYWTAMGTSRSYSVFLGLGEVAAAALLLCRRTSLAGALLAAFILANVLAVNFCFGIDVKILSAFLLLLAIIVVWPHRRRLAGVFFLQQETIPERVPPAVVLQHRRWGRTWLKALLAVVLLANALWPYLQSGNYNDDEAQRPPLHGAYRVLQSSGGWKRFFIHRQGFLILQDTNDVFTDIPAETDTATRTIWLSPPTDTVDYAVYYEPGADGAISLSGWLKQDSFWIEGRRLAD